MIDDCQGDWMRFKVDSYLQQTIVLDARENAVWNATREICQVYSVPYYKPLPPMRKEGEEGVEEEQEVPPWLRKRGGGAGMGSGEGGGRWWLGGKKRAVK